MTLIPAGEALNGLEFKPLDDGDTPVEAIILIKYMNPEGETGWALRMTAGLPDVEVIGALTVMQGRQMTQFESGWQPDSSDEDEP